MLDISFCVSWSDFVQTVNEKLKHGLEDGTFSSNKVEICVDEAVVKKVGFDLIVNEALSQIKAHIRAMGKGDGGRLDVEYRDASFDLVEGSKARYAIITDNSVKVMVVSNLCTKLSMSHPVLDSIFKQVCGSLGELMRTECRKENLERWTHKENVVKMCIQRTVSNELAFFAKHNLAYTVSPGTFNGTWDVEFSEKHETYTLTVDLDLFLGTIKVYVLNTAKHNEVMVSETLEFEKVNEHND